MKVSYLVAIGLVVLFALFLMLDSIPTSAPAGKKTDSTQTPVSIQPDSLKPIHKGDIIKQKSTRDIFEALAEDKTKFDAGKPD